MTDSTDSIEYLSLVAYFSDAQIALPSILRECIRLSYDVLGRITVHGSVTEGEISDVEREQIRAARSPQRAMEQFRHAIKLHLASECAVPELERVRSPSFTVEAVPPDSKHKTVDTLWNLSFHPSQIQHGHRLDPCLCINFNLTRLSESAIEALSTTAVEFGAIVEREPSFFYGLADVADVTESGAGLYYSGTLFPSWVRVGRWVNDILWYRAGERRRSLARDVYWGNILSPSLLEKLGGSQSLKTEFQQTWAAPLGNQDGLFKTYERGSAFISLSSSVRQVRRSSTSLTPPILDNAAWLRQKLHSVALLL